MSEPYEIDGHQVVIGTSVGIAVGPTDGTTPDQLIRNADLALYRAKGDGRGTFRFFEPEMDAQMQARRAWSTTCARRWPAGEFELYYQPVVDLASNEISGFEALIRWRHPEKGMVPPNTFIPLAEEIGLIVPLGEWASGKPAPRPARGRTHIKIAVNLSPAQFRSPGLVQMIVNALAASGLAPERLELEITETILLQDSEATLAMLYQLRELGVRIAMDDFGTGYSSLSYLQSFPFDQIKIDRSFVKDIAELHGLAQHRAGGGGAGQRARHGDDRGRRRDRAAAARSGRRAAPRCRASCSASRGRRMRSRSCFLATGKTRSPTTIAPPQLDFRFHRPAPRRRVRRVSHRAHRPVRQFRLGAGSRRP